MELVSTDSAVAEQVSKAYFDSLKDDGVDIGTAVARGDLPSVVNDCNRDSSPA
jgi:hypothetical protein